MEAVPRLPMLSFDLRTSVEKVDFSSKLNQYIRYHYNEDPILYASGITGIDSLRREAVNPSRSIDGCSVMKRYYCQLHFMASRFPMRENEAAAVTFSWKFLHSNSTLTLNDVSLEMASILYNIGALHTQLGAMNTRTTSDGMKMSCTHFQCAAWAFQHVNNEFKSAARSLGFSPVLMAFMSHLCLAQAQECILEKSMMDNRKSSITAKVGIQVVDYYRQSLGLLNEWPSSEDNPSDISSLKVYKNWNKYVLFKIAYYESISYLFQGQQSEDQQKMGERVTLYQAAFEKLEETRKLPPGIDTSESVAEALTFVNDVIEAKRKVAKSENEFIYHETVPSLSSLPKIKGASLVKGIPFDINDPEVCGVDLFSSIVPMEAHESASLYSEEKAKLLRSVNAMIENKDEELETFLSMLDLNEIMAKMDGNKLPQELVDRCASLGAKPDAIQNLTEAMGKLSDVYQDVGSMLGEIQEMLMEEENHEKEYQQILGKRPPSIAATDLTREAKKYQEAHAKASESNQTLHKAMVMHISNLKLLSLPLKDLISHLPAVNESSEVEVVVKEMQHLVSKVEEMKQQRLVLASQLRDLICQDDITRQLITYTGDKIEELFQEELKKYDRHVSIIEQNLAAQENILRALKDTYARYGSTRKNTGDLHKRRSAMISSLIASYDAYEDLLSKSSKGLDFYKKLETNVSKLLQRVKGTCKVQDEEREQMLRTVKKPETVTSQPDIPTGTMKLKDYLNIKKETGKLSLEPSTPVPSNTSYYSDSSLAQQNWIPGVRPAPVGSEETHANFKAQDSFNGFYQNQGNEQVWNNSYYSAPQGMDQKLKYFQPQTNSAYANYPESSPYTPRQDTYPISSYSTMLPKAEGQGGYEPKSNYYDIQSSPNRCYNTNSPYVASTTPSSATNVASYAMSDVNYGKTAEPNLHGQTATNVPYYEYPGQAQVAYSNPQQPYPNYPGQVDTVPGAYPSSYQTIENQPEISTYSSGSYHPQQNLASTYPSNDPGQISCNSSSATQVQPSPTYKPFSTSQTEGYASTVTDQTNCYNVPSNPGTYPSPHHAPAPAPVASATNFVQQDQISSAYPNAQKYQSPATTFAADNQISAPATQTAYSYGVTPTTCFPGSQTNEVPTPYLQYSSTTLSNWPGVYPSQQYFQSGNESLYTASQSPAQYAMTNSDLYKAPDGQGVNYNAYGNQYYNSQYGAYNVQSDYGSQNGNPVTYMQAGTEKQQAVTTTTFSNSEAKSSPGTNPSNLDLLAGLDFNISHSPLVPEPTMNTKKEEQSPETVNAVKGKVSVKTEVETVTEATAKLNLSKDPSSVQAKEPPKKVSKENFSNFTQEVEKFGKFVDGLTLKTLNGPTSLDVKWKEIVDMQEKISPQLIISVARCYPMKNRFPDILPYDDSRVELPSTKDDYINASKMTGLTESTPPFILTQAPLPSTYGDFWAMVFEQQVEVIVCLLNDFEFDGHLYWPADKGQELEVGKLKISLQSSNIRPYWVERILSVCLMETRVTRVVVHLQFTAWPGSSFPESPSPFLTFSSECINFFNQQRSYSHPVVVHCTSGVGRTGLFCLVIASILDVQAGRGIPEIPALAGRMCLFRKSCLRDREHLKFAYQAVLRYCQDFLVKRGLTSDSSFSTDKTLKNGKSDSEETAALTVSDTTDPVQGGMDRLQIDSSGKQKRDLEDKNVLGSGRSQSVCSTISRTSSGRSSPSSLPPDSSIMVDASNFALKTESSGKRKNKFSAEDFNKSSTKDVLNPSDDDPLSQLDPLWTMKK